jgi:DNA-binding CsgD family transcriptional regulator
MAPGSLVLPLLVAYAAFIGCVYIFTKAQAGETGGPISTGASPSQVSLHLDVSAVLRDQCSRVSDGKGLTARELDVLCEIASGKSMPTIAEAMGLSVNTVKSHAAHVYSKLDVHSRDDLISLMNDAQCLEAR